MADETIIIDVVLNTKDQVENAARLRTAIDELKKTQEDLRKNGEANSVQFEANAAALRDLQGQYRQATKDIDNVNKQIQAETGSIAANRAELARLTAEYIKQAKPSAELTARIKGLSDRLKEQEKAIGDTRRNVGNYAESFTSVLTSFQSAPGTIGAVATGFTTLGTAVAAGTGGLSLLIPALVSLFQIFSQNAAFADGFKFALDGVSKALQFIVDEAVKLAGPLTRVFTEPKKALVDLGNFIEQNLINRFKAFGVIARAAADGDLKKLSDGFIQLTSGVENGTDKIVKFYNGVVTAGKNGFQAAKELDALVVTSAKINGEIQKTDQSIRALTFTLRDRSKAERDRIKIANEIANLEINNANKRVELAKQELAIEQQKLKGKTLSGEEEARIEKLKTDVLLAEGEVRTALAQKQTRINILLQREELNATKQTAKEKEKTVAKSEQDIEKERLKAEQERKKQEEENAKTIAETRKKEYEDSLNFANEYYTKLQTEAKLQYANGEISEQEYRDKIKEIQSQSLESQLTIQKDYGESTVQVDAKIADEKVAKAEEVADEEERLRKEKEDAERALADSLVGLANAVAMNSKDNAEMQKAIAVFQLAIDSAMAIGKVTSTSAAGDPYTYAIRVAANVATVLANIARATAILSAAPKQFYEGGYTGDGDPRQESTAVGKRPYIYHKQEYIIPHKLLAEPVVSSFVSNVIEPKRRGKLPSGLPGMFDGGFATTNVRSEVNASLQSNALIKAIGMMRPVVQVSEINTVQQRVKVLDTNSTL